MSGPMAVKAELQGTKQLGNLLAYAGQTSAPLPKVKVDVLLNGTDLKRIRFRYLCYLEQRCATTRWHSILSTFGRSGLEWDEEVETGV